MGVQRALVVFRHYYKKFNRDWQFVVRKMRQTTVDQKEEELVKELGSKVKAIEQ